MRPEACTTLVFPPLGLLMWLYAGTLVRVTSREEACLHMYGIVLAAGEKAT